jgi:hypothetical protein
MASLAMNRNRQTQKIKVFADQELQISLLPALNVTGV